MKGLTAEILAGMFDHTMLKPDARYEDCVRVCREAKEYGFKIVAINSFPVKTCKELLRDTPVGVGAAIGFPLGQTTIEVKSFEVEDAFRNGADEIDYVINIGQAKDGHWDYIEREMHTIIETVRRYGKVGKAIFENCYLTKEEIARAAEIAARVKPDFVKTSTGMGTGGALIEDVRLMKSIVGEEVGVKAAGGIRTLESCLAMIEAGASRIGSSSGIAIVEEFRRQQG